MAGLVIIPVLPMLVKKDLPPNVNLYVLYLINLLTTVVSYWLFAYKNCLLFAHQRNDIGWTRLPVEDNLNYFGSYGTS